MVDEFADGISSIGAAVVDDAGVVFGTLHAHGPTYRFPDPDMADQVGALIATTASSILGHPVH